ncbi:MAG TPA: hypothetical protein DDY68_05340, partial [Porphyromonadaceae bacterium]|nr:hypothetical protein [Porphyromonadaceae bacterium]
MMMYKRLNVLLGWVVFAIATYTYCSTIEPTASFWDCGEFIASAFNLEVGHPPGNPFFMLVGNFFTHFAKDTAHVAVMVNVMSALLSAFTILFLFWTITHLTRKIVQEDCAEEPSLAEAIKILGSGVVGALVYTWSDTFWFSAVEGEVYAFSSFLTALVFWLILKWEEVADKSWSDKWIVLIAYIVGISIGVHLLNLLCIPAIVLVYYFRKAENVTLKGTMGAVGISFVIVLLALYGLIQGLVEVAGYFELFFVNVLGLPFQSGVLFYLLCTIAILIWGVYETEVQKSPLKMRIPFALSVILLGIPFIGSG